MCHRPNRMFSPGHRWGGGRRKDWSWLEDKPPLATVGMLVLLGLDDYGSAREYVDEWQRQRLELLTMSMGEVFERQALQYQALTGASREAYMEFCARHFPRTWAGLHPERTSPQYRPLPEEASFAV